VYFVGWMHINLRMSVSYRFTAGNIPDMYSAEGERGKSLSNNKSSLVYEVTTYNDRSHFHCVKLIDQIARTDLHQLFCEVCQWVYHLTHENFTPLVSLENESFSSGHHPRTFETLGQDSYELSPTSFLLHKQ
jgi:hypothetical protein